MKGSKKEIEFMKKMEELGVKFIDVTKESENEREK